MKYFIVTLLSLILGKPSYSQCDLTGDSTVFVDTTIELSVGSSFEYGGVYSCWDVAPSNIPSSITIEWFRLDSITNLPTGLSSDIRPCVQAGLFSDSSCGSFLISGTPRKAETKEVGRYVTIKIAQVAQPVSGELSVVFDSLGISEVPSLAISIMLKEVSSKLKAYPNPAQHWITITWDENLKNASIRLFDMMGVEYLRTDDIQGNSYELDASQLGSGLYYYMLLEGKHTIAKGKLWVN